MIIDFHLSSLFLFFFSPKHLNILPGVYLTLVSVVSFIFILAQMCFQILMLSDTKLRDRVLPTFPPNTPVEDVPVVASLLHQFGFQRLDVPSPVNVLRIVVPDVIVFISAIAVYFTCVKLTRKSVCIHQ